MPGGRCRKCGCQSFDCNALQYAVNGFTKTVDVIACGFAKAFGNNCSPNENLAYRRCSCGHHYNYHA